MFVEELVLAQPLAQAVRFLTGTHCIFNQYSKWCAQVADSAARWPHTSLGQKVGAALGSAAPAASQRVTGLAPLAEGAGGGVGGGPVPGTSSQTPPAIP